MYAFILNSKERRLTQQKEKLTLSITYQKKLFARQAAKEHLKNMKIGTLAHLEETRIFKDPTFNQYYLKLMPHFYNKVDSLTQENTVVVENVTSNLTY